jgi:hypothetical protein
MGKTLQKCDGDASSALTMWAVAHKTRLMEKEIVKRLEDEAKRRGISVTTLCRLAVNDGKLVARLKAGGSVTLATLRKLESWLEAPQKEPS